MAKDMIDLSKVSSKKTSKKGKKVSSKKTVKKAKKSGNTGTRYEVTDAMEKKIASRFKDWKKGTTLQAISDELELPRNTIWTRFRTFAGSDAKLHKLRANGAGGSQGARRFS